MSELILVDYHDPHRAGEVLDALNAQHAEWSADLKDSVVFVKHADDTVRLVRPGQRSKAQTGSAAQELADTLLSAARLQEHMGLPDDVLHQVRRLVRPGDSALLMRVRMADPDLVIDAVQSFGGRVLRASFTSQQAAPL